MKKKAPTLADVRRNPELYTKELEELQRQLAAMPRFVSPLEDFPKEYVDAVKNWPDRAQDELTAGDAAEIIRSVKGVPRKLGSRVSGERRTLQARDSHQDWATEAKKLLSAGRAQHEISSILAQRFQVTARAMRTALQDEGVLKKRKVI
ncbi:hypothetical protein [Rhodanobacter glycinis]|uniref:hypothetical protein n=1 Tax=Rhodanobacter glycinis TaxID=582702 RepID=UPI001113AA7E|nr:hypothetical protein [Rhodanobacter glycinis]